MNQLDGFEARGNIKVLMATNRPDTLDPALLRPGRLDRKIEFGLPDLEVNKSKAPSLTWAELSLSECTVYTPTYLLVEIYVFVYGQGRYMAFQVWKEEGEESSTAPKLGTRTSAPAYCCCATSAALKISSGRGAQGSSRCVHFHSREIERDR